MSLDEVLAAYDPTLPLEDARTIPGSWYTDPGVFAREQARVFGGPWQLVARADQLVAPGQFVTATVGTEPILVVRGKDGVLRAFYNVCRHHAAAVMTEPAGCAERLRCPYHGWTYSLAGHLTVVSELEGTRNFAREDNGLVPVPLAVWENLVFVHLGESPPSLESHLGRMKEQVAPLGIADLHFVERREWTIACNWKVFVDNYLDGGYHIPFLHRGLSSILPFKEYTIECMDRFCLQSSPIDPGADGGVTASVRKGKARYFWLYPNLMLNWYEGYLDTNLVVPLGIDRMKVVFDFYFADVSEAARERNARSIEVSSQIQDEDHDICVSVQKGLGSRAYGAGRLSVRREAGEHLFHRLLAHDLQRKRS